MSALPKTCAVCPATLGRDNGSGYCIAHFRSSPAVRKKISDALRLACKVRPEMREARRHAGRVSAAAPGEKERRSRDAKARGFWKIGHDALTPATYAKIGASVSATRLAWCPPHLRQQYRDLVRLKRWPAAEARAMILEQDETDMRRWRQSIGAEKPLPIEIAASNPEAQFVDRAAEIAAHWSDVPSIWDAGQTRELVRARWAVFLALKHDGMNLSEIAAATGFERTTIRYALPKAEVLAAAPTDFAELYRRVVAA